MRQLIITCALSLMAFGLNAQGFIYGGYRMGKYFAAEPVAQNYAAKFNAGWEFQPEGTDSVIPLFFPGSDKFEVTKHMEWNNLPAGINVGIVQEVEDGFCITIGFQQIGQKGSGERTNLSTGSTEKFTIFSRATTLSFGVGYNVADLIIPYINFEFGRYNFRYSYQSNEFDISRQRIGYNTRLIGGTKPGDKTLCMAIDYGFYLTALSVGNVVLRLAPQYQARLDLLEEIYMGAYQDKIFKHDNFSLAAVLTYTID